MAGMFLGRENELAMLRSALHSTTDSGRFVLVRGEPGIGKSALIEATLRPAPAAKRVLRAGADVMDRRRPHGLLLDALAPELTDEDRAVIATRTGYAVGERLHLVIDRVAIAPTVLVLEDLHWSDPESLGLLSRLSHSLAQIPLLIVGSVRPHVHNDPPPGLDHLVSGLSERGLLQPIELGPLPHTACMAIAAQMAGGRPGDVLAGQVATAGGNPLFVTELLRALLRDGSVTIGHDGAASIAAPTGPSPSLGMVIMSHLSHLDRPTRELLGTAALLGSHFPAAHLQVAAGRPMTALLPMLREALAAGILEENSQQMLAFRHELIQAVLVQDLPESVRAELHREIAIRLDDAGIAATTVAEHLLRAPTHPQDIDRLVHLTRTAAPEVTTQLWRRVEDATPPESGTHLEARVALAAAALRAGRVARASQIAEITLRRQVPAGVAARLSGIRTRALMMAGDHASARDEAERCSVTELFEPADRAMNLAYAGWSSFMLGDIAGARSAALRTDAMAAEADSCGARVWALTLRGLIANCRGDLARAESILSAAVAQADRHPCPVGIEVFPHAQLAVALADLDRVGDAATVLHRGQDIAADMDYRTGVVATHTLGAQVLSHSGSVADIAAELDAHRSMVGAMDLQLDRPMRGLWAHVMARQQGPGAAVDWARKLDPVPGRGTWPGRGRSWIWLGRSQIERAAGDRQAAFEVLWSGWEELRATDMLMDCAEIALDLVELSRTPRAAASPQSTSVRDRVDEVVGTLTTLAGNNPAVTHLQATALAVRGVAATNVAQLLDAERLMATTVRRFDHARIAELAVHVGPGRRADSVRLADVALRGYAEVGAGYDVARARRQFRTAGVRVPRQSHARPTSGWGALTHTEERIARQVATGATNSEIAQHLCVSRRTVESHVSSILAKLEVRSRTEVALLVARGVDA